MRTGPEASESWWSEANCSGTDPEAFFPEKGGTDASETAVAKRVCGGCPVSVQCGEWALDRPDLSGIWGGMTERERRAIRRQSRRVPR